MNDKTFENKVNRDIGNTKKDLVTLMEDGITGLSRTFEQLTDNAKNKVAGAVKAINKSVGHGMSQYNGKIQDVADRVPGGFGKKAARYPWVTVTMFMAFGLLLGVVLKPSHRSVG